MRGRGGGILERVHKKKEVLLCDVSIHEFDPFFAANPLPGLTFVRRQEKVVESGPPRSNSVMLKKTKMCQV